MTAPEISAPAGTEQGERGGATKASVAPRAPLPQDLVDLIEGEWVASCLAQDGREVGQVGAAAVLCPDDRALVVAALVEAGFLIPAGGDSHQLYAIDGVES